MDYKIKKSFLQRHTPQNVHYFTRSEALQGGKIIFLSRAAGGGKIFNRVSVQSKKTVYILGRMVMKKVVIILLEFFIASALDISFAMAAECSCQVHTEARISCNNNAFQTNLDPIKDFPGSVRGIFLMGQEYFCYLYGAGFHGGYFENPSRQQHNCSGEGFRLGDGSYATNSDVNCNSFCSNQINEMDRRNITNNIQQCIDYYRGQCTQAASATNIRFGYIGGFCRTPIALGPTPMPPQVAGNICGIEGQRADTPSAFLRCINHEWQSALSTGTCGYLRQQYLEQKRIYDNKKEKMQRSSGQARARYQADKNRAAARGQSIRVMLDSGYCENRPDAFWGS